MPETTAIEEQAKLYERSINDLKRGHQEAIELHVARYDEVEKRAKDQAAELKAQADGLLGTLGRINAENADLKSKLQDERENGAQIRFEITARMSEFQGGMERLKEEKERLIRDMEVMREQAQAKIQELQEELAKAKGKK